MGIRDEGIGESIREPHTNELQNRIANEPLIFTLSAKRSSVHFKNNPIVCTTIGARLELPE